jgi:hypothetical protein
VIGVSSTTATSSAGIEEEELGVDDPAACVAARWCAVAPQPATPQARIAAREARRGKGVGNRSECTYPI